MAKVEAIVRKMQMLRALLWLGAATLTMVCVAPAMSQTVSTGTYGINGGHPALRPGDVVRLNIWREPDLSGEFAVDINGDIVFPKIGTISVLNMSADSLKHFLVRAYTPFLRDPSIDVTILRRVTVSGFVRAPGLYKADATMSISDVVALAGGAAPDGVADRVELMRGGKTIKAQLSEETRVGNSAVRSGDELYIPQRSWLSRNAALVAAAISSVGIVTATVLSRH